MKNKAGHFLFITLFCLFFIAVFSSCSSCNNNPEIVKVDTLKTVTPVRVPDFNADSAYAFCDIQVGFGPRIPGTASQQKCAAFFEKKLTEFCDTVYVQRAFVKIYDGSH